MLYAFNNQAYPIVTSEADILRELRNKPKAVIFRFSGPEQDITRRIVQGLHFTHNPDLACEYLESPWNDERKVAGEKIVKAVSRDHILSEAKEVDLQITPEAVDLLTARVQKIDGMYSQVYARYVDGLHTTREPVGRMLMTPIGGKGRASMMHVDNFYLAAHSSFTEATLNLSDGEISQEMWELMHFATQQAWNDEERYEKSRRLEYLSTMNLGEFSHAEIGDVVFLLGQRDKDIRKPEDQSQVSVHISSQYIKQYGQAAVMFHDKEANNPPELEM